MIFRYYRNRAKPDRNKVMANSKSKLLVIAIALCLANPSAGAETTDKPAGKAQVLNPDNYVGQVKAGYAAAKEIPEICAKLFCYCGCDLTDCHGSLLDCFTSDHGVDCHVCQEESILALKLHKKGKSLADIQKFIDKRYAKEYPFEVESPVLQKYKNERLWDAGKKSAEASTPNKNGSRKKSDGSCCSGGEKQK